MISKPGFVDRLDPALRREIIFRTYINAKEAGDENVYFIDGSMFFENAYRDTCLSDGCHHTEVGFKKMAASVTFVLRRAIKE